MDIFKFKNPIAPTRMEQGEIINGIRSKMWIERYNSEGEFSLTAPVSSGLREKLPIGSFISHVKTAEIMIVENHEISANQDSEPDVVVTGRGFETFLENRIVGSNKVFPVSEELTEYVLGQDFTWNQAVVLINDHILASELVDSNSAVPFVTVLASIVGSSVSIERTVSRGSLYDRVLELLSIDNLGIKVARPGPLSPLPDGNINTALVIHTGNNRTNEVIFSHDAGEIISADYLWSNRWLKNAALVSGRWVETVVTPVETEYSRRMMYVEASDIDQDFEAPPTGADLTAVVAAMQQRGIEVLAAQLDIALTKAEVAKEGNKSLYRVDFDVGDIVTVMGDYNEDTYMRVSEYVEIEDETGESGYPTLTLD